MLDGKTSGPQLRTGIGDADQFNVVDRTNQTRVDRAQVATTDDTHAKLAAIHRIPILRLPRVVPVPDRDGPLVVLGRS